MTDSKRWTSEEIFNELVRISRKLPSRHFAKVSLNSPLPGDELRARFFNNVCKAFGDLFIYTKEEATLQTFSDMVEFIKRDQERLEMFP